jgi:hypothetical protein
MNTTALLKASIDHEQSKSDLTNLLNHKEGNLSLVADAIEHYMREFQSEINIRERVIEQAEDLTDHVRANLNEAIAWRKDQLQSLIAWRIIFFGAIERVKR